MPTKRILPLLLGLALLSSCTEDPAAPRNPLASGTDDTASSSSLKRRAAEALFSQDTIRRIELILAPESLATIDAAPTAERWVGGILVLDGDTIDGVGIRYKGNEGAWYACVEGGPWGGGRKTCPLNMKVKIDHGGRDTAFHGMKMFQLHAMNDAPSKLTEHVAYWFVRRMGIPSPRTAFCELHINGRFEGLYLHVEEMDGRFVDTWQPGSDANLFKEMWPLWWDSTAVPASYMVDALRTNKKKGDVSRLRAFALELEAATDSVAVRAAIEKWLDVEEVIGVAALTLALDDDDGVFHWYAVDETSDHGAWPHNFYWIEDPAKGTFRLLPWDLDKAFTRVADPEVGNAIEILDPWGTTSHGCRNYGSGWRQRSAACDKLVAGLASYRELYAERLQSILDGPFSKVDSLVDAWERKLAPIVDSLPADNPQGIEPSAWKNGVARLRGEIAASRLIVAETVARMRLP